MIKKILILTLIFFIVSCNATENSKIFTVGLLTNSSNGLRNIEGFKEGMKIFGYVEGENITYIFSGEPTSEADDLASALQAMIEANVDLIFTAGTPTGVAAYKATQGTNIPVVFGVIADPIISNVVDNLENPGGNITGVQLSQNQTRRLESLLRLIPQAKKILIPYDDSDGTSGSSAVAQLDVITSQLNIELVKVGVHNDEDVTNLFANFPDDVDAIFMVPDNMINPHFGELLAIANERKLPISGPSTAQVEEGALTTYGFIHTEVGAQAARIAHQILQGANPGKIPVETAEFFLAINLKNAEIIGVEIPQQLLEQTQTIYRE